MSVRLRFRRLARVGSFFVLVFLMSPLARAVPPLNVDHVPTTPAKELDAYGAYDYSEAGKTVTRQEPIVQLFYGVSDRQDVSLAVPYVNQQKQQGFAGFTVGTKYQFFKEDVDAPVGIAGSVNAHFPSTSDLTGADQQMLEGTWQLKLQKNWGNFAEFINGGLTLEGGYKSTSPTAVNDYAFSGGWGQEWQANSLTQVLSEIYWNTSHTRAGENGAVAGLGVRQKLCRSLFFNTLVGKSIRDDNKGGPRLRIYAGLLATFDTRRLPKS